MLVSKLLFLITTIIAVLKMVWPGIFELKKRISDDYRTRNGRIPDEYWYLNNIITDK